MPMTTEIHGLNDDVVVVFLMLLLLLCRLLLLVVLHFDQNCKRAGCVVQEYKDDKKLGIVIRRYRLSKNSET